MPLLPRVCSSRLLAVALLVAALYPGIARRIAVVRAGRRLDAAAARGAPPSAPATARSLVRSPMEGCEAPDPALLVRVAELGPLLASWQTVGGCGAGSATAGAGVKWVGRGVRGGLFNVTCQANYTRIVSNGKREQHTFFNTLITRDLGEKWNLGANVPFVYKYLDDPYDLGVDLSNGGLGDLSLQLTRRLGNINATSLTGIVGVPTGVYDARYRMSLLHQHQQVGFGEVTGALLLDHVMDEVWGLMVVGGVASWRGGQNKIDNYRAPNATAYYYAGYYLGPFVPVAGLSVTGFTGHDRDLTQEERTGLLAVAGNVSLEWSNDWMALLAGATFPYQYDGFRLDSQGNPRSPWGFGAWMVALGVAVSPF